MRVLVTGIGGFVGPRLARAPARARRPGGGHLRSTTAARLPDGGRALRGSTCRDAAALDARGQRRRARTRIVHLAGLSHVGESWQRMPRLLPGQRARHRERCCAAAAGRPVVFASSAEVYGAGARRRSSRSREDAAARRRARPYALTKAAAERLALGARRGGGALVQPGRPRARRRTSRCPPSPRQLAAHRRAASSEPVLRVGNLSARRDFVHVDDGAEAFRCSPRGGSPAAGLQHRQRPGLLDRRGAGAPDGRLRRRRPGSSGPGADAAGGPAAPAGRRPAACAPSAGSPGAPWTTRSPISGRPVAAVPAGRNARTIAAQFSNAVRRVPHSPSEERSSLMKRRHLVDHSSASALCGTLALASGRLAPRPSTGPQPRTSVSPAGIRQIHAGGRPKTARRKLEVAFVETGHAGRRPQRLEPVNVDNDEKPNVFNVTPLHRRGTGMLRIDATVPARTCAPASSSSRPRATTCAWALPVLTQTTTGSRRARSAYLQNLPRNATGHANIEIMNFAPKRPRSATIQLLPPQGVAVRCPRRR